MLLPLWLLLLPAPPPNGIGFLSKLVMVFSASSSSSPPVPSPDPSKMCEWPLAAGVVRPMLDEWVDDASVTLLVDKIGLDVVVVVVVVLDELDRLSLAELKGGTGEEA